MPVIETLNKAKNRIDVTCSPDPNHIDHRPLGYIDAVGDYHLPNGSILPASGGLIDPDGTRRNGSVRLIVRPDGTVTTPGTRDAIDPDANLRNSIHAVDAAQQAAYDTQNPTK